KTKIVRDRNVVGGHRKFHLDRSTAATAASARDLDFGPGWRRDVGSPCFGIALPVSDSLGRLILRAALSIDGERKDMKTTIITCGARRVDGERRHVGIVKSYVVVYLKGDVEICPVMDDLHGAVLRVRPILKDVASRAGPAQIISHRAIGR